MEEGWEEMGEMGEGAREEDRGEEGEGGEDYTYGEREEDNGEVDDREQEEPSAMDVDGVTSHLDDLSLRQQSDESAAEGPAPRASWTDSALTPEDDLFGNVYNHGGSAAPAVPAPVPAPSAPAYATAEEPPAIQSDASGITYKTPLEWRRDVSEQARLIKWRLNVNHGNTAQDAGAEVGKVYVDLNYVTLEGDIDKIAHMVVNSMSQKPSVDDVKSIIMEKSRESITVAEAYDLIEESKLIDNSPRQSKRSLNVVEIEKDIQGRVSVHVCISAIGMVVSQSLIEDAIRSLAHQSMKPQTYLLGTMSHRPDMAIFDQVTISEADCAKAKRKEFAVISPVFIPPRLRRMIFLESTSDPDSIMVDPDTKEMVVMKATYAALAMGESRGVRDAEDYQDGRAKRILKVATDLDDWAYIEHFVTAGIPIRYNELEGDYEWLPLTHSVDDVTTEGYWQPLPTPHNLMRAYRRAMLKDPNGIRRLEYIHNGGDRVTSRPRLGAGHSGPRPLLLGAAPSLPPHTPEGDAMDV